MKTKILTKLISVVCAAAIATSCTAMSVGAVPPKGQTETKAQVNWKEICDIAKGLLDRAEALKMSNASVEECSNLADDIANFAQRAEIGDIVSGIQNKGDWIAILSFLIIVDVPLRDEENLDMRKVGIRMATTFLPDIIALIEQHMQ